MRIHFDAVSISSVLLTLSLLALVPHNLQYASTWQQLYVQESSRLYVQNWFMPIGFASLALVLVGLIVIWSGYIARERSAWFVMFVIVWVFAFPVHVLPLLLHWLRAPESIDWPAWFWGVVRGSELDRAAAKGPLDFLLMAVALFLPIKPFFRRSRAARGAPPPSATTSSRAGGTT
jgi:hypothetical protein